MPPPPGSWRTRVRGGGGERVGGLALGGAAAGRTSRPACVSAWASSWTLGGARERRCHCQRCLACGPARGMCASLGCKLSPLLAFRLIPSPNHADQSGLAAEAPAASDNSSSMPETTGKSAALPAACTTAAVSRRRGGDARCCCAAWRGWVLLLRPVLLAAQQCQRALHAQSIDALRCCLPLPAGPSGDGAGGGTALMTAGCSMSVFHCILLGPCALAACGIGQAAFGRQLYHCRQRFRQAASLQQPVGAHQQPLARFGS